MPLQQIALPAEYYPTSSVGATGSSLINMLSEKLPAYARYPFRLFGRPGLKSFKSFASTIKAMHVFNGFLYVFEGANIRKYDSAFGETLVSDAFIASGIVHIEDNDVQMAVLDDAGRLFIIKTDDTVVTASLPFIPYSLIYLKGYFLASQKDNRAFFWSAPLDGTAWDALSFNSAIEKSDNILRLFAFNDAVRIYKQGSREIFWDTGSNDVTAPLFSQIEGSTDTTVGVAGRDAVCAFDGRPWFLGSDRIFYTENGYSPQRKSTAGVEELLQTLDDVSDCRLQPLMANGHKCILMTLASAGISLIYDIGEDKWHRWKSYGISRWRVNRLCVFNGKLYASDFATGKLFTVETDTAGYDEGTDEIECIIDTPPADFDGNRMQCRLVHVNVDTGNAPLSDVSPEPFIALSYSDNGGVDFSQEYYHRLGVRGEYGLNIAFRIMGMFRGRIWRLRYTGPTWLRITGFNAEYAQGSHN